MIAPSVRIPAAKYGEFVAFVTLPDQDEVRVRFSRQNKGTPWKCDDHGTHRFSTCPHEKAAHAAYLKSRKDTTQCE